MPFASLEGFASQPVDARPFAYAGSGSTEVADRLTRTAGFCVTAGVELRDGHGADSQLGLVLGIMLGHVYKPDDDDMVGGFGASLRFAL